MEEAELLDERLDTEAVVKGSFAEQNRHVLKHGNTFGVFEAHGDIEPGGAGELGLYHHDVRHLSKLQLRLNDLRPVLLNATVRRDNTLLVADMTNPDFFARDGTRVPHGAIHIFRAKLLWQDVLYEHVRLHNYGENAVDLTVSYELDADFRDMFEIRGKGRSSRGRHLADDPTEEGFAFAYRGLDDVVRRTHCSFTPDFAGDRNVQRSFHLKRGSEVDAYLTVACSQNRRS